MNQIEFQSVQDGILLPVQAHAGARKNLVMGVHAGRMKISVTTAPEKGKANEALRILIAKTFGLAKSRVSLVSGITSAHKVFLLADLSLKEARQRLVDHQILSDGANSEQTE